MLTSGNQLAHTECEVRFDRLSRQLYATDASIYQVEPLGVAFPRDSTQASAIIHAAAHANIPVIPRGAGTGLVGGALGRGLIVEFARHNNKITQLNLEERTVQVGPGVVLDELNAFLKPHGFCFGPDVATSSRATLGGMIANNSSGSHVPIYGTTADHLDSAEIVLADGTIETVGPHEAGLPEQRALLQDISEGHAREIAARCPPGLLKRWPGYGLDRCRTAPNDLSKLLAGSEGTLAAITSARLRIVPLPRQKGLGLLFFASVAEAMRATVDLLDLQPAAIEHVDRVLFDQTRGQLAFRAARDLLQLDTHPCESILLVEFFDDAVAERLESLASKKLGLRSKLLNKPAEMNLVWGMRKAGLSLLTGCKGAAKPATGIEDIAVRPEQLPDYVQGLQGLLQKLDLQACFYGHAATGLLHVRPVLDLHSSTDLKKFRQLANDVSGLVRQFKGSLAAEHGVGIARTEFLAQHLGPELMGAMRQIKSAFDPRNIFNPGKLFDPEIWKFDQDLRWNPGDEFTLPFTPTLAFAAKDRSFTGNLEQCNGCGGCRKSAPTMCPTFLATGEEIMSTRGRANTIRAALERDQDPLRSAELEAALSNCLSCKACTVECPSNVNLALLKAELLHARHQRYGMNQQQRVLSSVDGLGRLGCLMPELANHILAWPGLRRLLPRLLGLSSRRPLMRYASQRFDKWFLSRPTGKTPSRAPVYLWDDTFVRYHEPHLGKAAVAVLEAAGFEVRLVRGRRCCGRPAFSQGHLDRARELGQHNLSLLTADPAPILFLEPSCYSMFAEDYRELNLANAAAVADRSFLFEHFIHDLLVREAGAIPFRTKPERVAIHAHCHAKSLINPQFMLALAQRLPARQATLLETGCCGMAGAFGALEEKYELSLQVAAPLVQQLAQLPEGTVVVASGTSCRHQIEHLTRYKPRHMAELLADSL